MSKSHKNEEVLLNAESIDSVAEMLASSEKAAPIFLADGLLAEAEGARTYAHGREMAAKSFEADALAIRNSLPKMREEFDRVVDKMRRTEKTNVDALLANPKVQIQMGDAKAKFIGMAQKAVRGELRKTEKYMGWVKQGEEISHKLEAAPGEIEKLEKAAKAALEEAKGMKAKAEELDAEARALLEALNA